MSCGLLMSVTRSCQRLTARRRPIERGTASTGDVFAARRTTPAVVNGRRTLAHSSLQKTSSTFIASTM